MYRKVSISAAAAMGLMVLILDAKTALLGARDGLQLCLQTVIPALFPFFVLSILLTGGMTGLRSGSVRFLSRICRIPAGSEIILLTGLLGGYPVGAQSVSQAWQSGRLSEGDARRMLGFCSNAGPSFLFGILSPMFPDRRIVWVLWGIQIVSAILTGFLLPGGSDDTVSVTPGRAVTVPEAVERSLRVVAKVCGWVIIFRVLLSFLNRWFFWLLPEWLCVLFSGFLELTNGCCQLDTIADPALRFLICAGMLSFGGICVCMQTVSAAGKMGLGLYFPGKLLQSALSFLLAAAAAPFLFETSGMWAVAPVLVILLAFVIFLRSALPVIQKKTVAIP